MRGSKYTVEYQRSVVDEDIPNLPTTAKNIIRRAIEERLTTDPMDYGKPLRYSFKGYRRLRVGDYRVIYKICEHTVIVSAIKHRKDVYEG